MPGIFCAVLSFFASWYFFIPPFYSFAFTGQSALALAFFIFIVWVDIVIIDRMLNAIDQLAKMRAEALNFARERDDLFKELQHRVGNNLNMVAAMLSIHARSISDEKSKHGLNEAAARIALIADINRMFHDPAHLDGGLDERFITELAHKCLDAAGVVERVSLKVQATPVFLPQSRFMPVALILAESINNAIEHGIAQEGPGTIEIHLTHDGKEARLTIDNDGRILRDDFNLKETKSIGLVLVQSFARQLGGSYTLTGGLSTTRSQLTFPLH